MSNGRKECGLPRLSCSRLLLYFRFGTVSVGEGVAVAGGCGEFAVSCAADARFFRGRYRAAVGVESEGVVFSGGSVLLGVYVGGQQWRVVCGINIDTVLLGFYAGIINI